MCGVCTDFLDPFKHQGALNLAECVQNELVGSGVGSLVCPIMQWITPSPPRQLCNRYPPFCGAKPKCVEQAGWGGCTGTRWRGEFSAPLLTRPPRVLTLLLFHTHTQTHAYKVQAKGFEGVIEGKGKATDTLLNLTILYTSYSLQMQVYNVSHISVGRS